MGKTRAMLVALLALAACSSSSSSGGPAPPPPSPGCAAWETKQSDGSCEGPGVSPSQCASGFVADGASGCTPVLPAMPCGEGTMAMPGDTTCKRVGPVDPPMCARGTMAVGADAACRPVADCGAAPWGSIPVDASTTYVDASYTGGSSDGSASHPFTTLAAAVGAAASGSIVAIAAGSYAENVSLGAKPLRIWGRCPEMVAIGTAAAAPALTFGGSGAAMSELHQVALTAAGGGVVIALGASGVAIDRVWIHDVTGTGISATAAFSLAGSLIENAQDDGVDVTNAHARIADTVVRNIEPGARLGFGISASSGASLDLSGSLVEKCTTTALLVVDSDLSVDASVVRDIQPNASQIFGRGIDVESGAAVMQKLKITNTLVERTWDLGIFVVGDTAGTIDGVLVRDVRSIQSTGLGGIGLQVQHGPKGFTPPTLTVHGSLFERAHGAGINVVGSAVVIDASSSRDTLGEEKAGGDGFGLIAQYDDASGARGTTTVRGSVFERNVFANVDVQGTDVTLDATLMRDGVPDNATVHNGVGLRVIDDPKAQQRGNAIATGCVITGNSVLGVVALSSDLTLDSTVVGDTHALASGFGFGVMSEPDTAWQANGTLVLRSSIVKGSFGAGVVAFNADVTIDRTLIRDTHAATDGTFGDGLELASATLTMTQSFVTSNARAGVASFGSSASLDGSGVECNPIDLDGEMFSGQDYSYDLGDGVMCAGCAAPAAACGVLSSNLAPPMALPAN